MRLVVQRVRKASVSVDDREVTSIGPGLLVLVGFSAQESVSNVHSARAVKRIIQLRIFDDPQGRLNRSLQEVQGELLLIPQVTLTVSLQKGTRPSFHTCAPPETAKTLFEAFLKTAQDAYPRTSAGAFRAHMAVSLENDGPVTLVLDF